MDQAGDQAPDRSTSTLLLRRVTTADDQTVDVRIDGPVITGVGRLAPTPSDTVVELEGWVLLGAPAEPHAHLDKAYTADRVPNPTGDLYTAIDGWMNYRVGLTVDDIVARARQAAIEALANGITAIRTHVDVGEGIDVRAAEALIRVRDELRGLLDLQIVGLVSAPVTGPDGAGNRAAQRAALELGIDVAGGCPHIDPDPLAAIETCMAMAVEGGVPLDLHMDETLTATTLGVRDLAALVTATGFERRVTASHCVSLGVQDASTQHQIARELAAAGIGVVTLPQTNLFLQGRDVPCSTPRGLTAIRALLDAGVVVAGGADNVQDPFNTMGRSDPFETASLLVMAAHLTPTQAWAFVTDAARQVMGLVPVAVAPGAPADLLAVRAPSLRAAIATAPADRIVWKAGVEVARTTTTRWVGVPERSGEGSAG